ncbi:MAG: hypothetical protein AMJ94_19185 [Deltaproteobacteria bacterium SM23_61]|nr:MAG: hypothetical protein AMJ94_19185 [Deltaproteobacteria bacterium SM23_61]
MTLPVVFILAAVFLLLLLVYERQEKEKGRLIAKTILSCLFVLVAFLQPSSVPSYGKFILIGLTFCLAGDVCLALSGDKIFRAGLVAFLLGHIFYVIGFTYLVPASEWFIPGSVLFWVFSLIVFLWLRPHLKAMLVAVAVYILVITVMASGAWAVLDRSGSPFWGRALVFAGALLFYVSDVFVARNQFIQREFLNRLIGLPLYYLGQFLLALSVGLL